MASVVIPSDSPFRQPAGAITAEVPSGTYEFESLGEETYNGVPRSGVMPIGTLALDYMGKYGLPIEG
jgi:hypothetical protein